MVKKGKVGRKLKKGEYPPLGSLVVVNVDEYLTYGQIVNVRISPDKSDIEVKVTTRFDNVPDFLVKALFLVPRVTNLVSWAKGDKYYGIPEMYDVSYENAI